MADRLQPTMRCGRLRQLQLASATLTSGRETFGSSANSTVSGGHTPVDITAGTSSLKDPIRITGLPA